MKKTHVHGGPIGENIRQFDNTILSKNVPYRRPAGRSGICEIATNRLVTADEKYQ